MPDLHASASLPVGLATIAGTTFFLWAATRLLKSGSREPGVPPGPPTVPILGNTRIMPKSASYIQYTEWAAEYGEIFSLVAGPTGLTVVLTSPEAIHELMEKQGAFTADRPTKVVVDLLTGGMMIGISRYNAYWKACRRAANEVLNAAGVARVLPIQVAESSQLMYDIMESPQNVYFHIQRFGISLMMSVVSGQRTPQFNSPSIKKIFDIHNRGSVILEPGFTPPLEMFPILKYVPERWAHWKKVIRETRAVSDEFYSDLLSKSEERGKTGQSNGCFLERVLKMPSGPEMSREGVCHLGHSMMSAGSTTTAAYLQFFVLIMMAYPEVQEKAQDEIDRVVGKDQAPSLQDIDSLPYVRAVIKEVHRFRPVGPMAMPHRTTADLVYKNYRIPADTVLFANTWGVFRQESLFRKADTFDPERFIKSPLGLREGVGHEKEEAYQRLASLPFGTGRRACPGVALAQQSISINVMNLLWAFSFAKARAADGTVIEPDLWAFGKGVTADPTPFAVDAQVRDGGRAALIKSNFIASSELFEFFERELSQEERDHALKTRGV